MQEILVLRVGAIQVLDEAHELYPGKSRQRALYRGPVLCHESNPFQFLHGIFSTDIVRKVKSSSQSAGNGPLPPFKKAPHAAVQLPRSCHSSPHAAFSTGQGPEGGQSERSRNLVAIASCSDVDIVT